MIARGFKPVGWVAAVGGAALACYMLSLNVAAERTELAAVEREIVLAKREIRELQTELGTRGRLQQLEHWNADVLALSAPASGQFLQNEFTLARYVQPEKSFEEKTAVHLASAEPVAQQPKAAPAVDRNFAPAPARLDKSLVRRASLVVGEVTPFVPAKAAPAKAASAKPAPAKVAPKPVKLADAKPAPARAAPRPAAAKPAPRSASLIGDSLAREIVAASKAESSGGAAQR